MPDVIYVLINQSMPGLVKIGRTNGDLEARIKQLDTTGIPLPFECFAAYEVENAIAAEKAMHTAFGDHRIRERREFFRVSPDKPTAILKAFGKLNVTPGFEVVECPEDSEALERARRVRPNFRFSMIDVKPGSVLHSVFDEDETAIVLDDEKVEFRGQTNSLSGSALILAKENGKNWKQIAGTQYWKFRDETLANLRDEVEQC